MNAQTTHEHIIRLRFTKRLMEWWAEADPEAVASAVDELLTDLGYLIKKPSLRKADPQAYKVLHREYMRVYQRKRRKAAAAATVILP